MQTIEEKTSKNEQAEKAVDEKVIENLKYPSVGKLQDMGIDYKPTTRYKIQSLDFNILKIPELDNIKPMVVSHRSRLSKKNLDDFDDDPADLFSPKIMVSPLQKNDNDSNKSEDYSGRRKLKPSLKA